MNMRSYRRVLMGSLSGLGMAVLLAGVACAPKANGPVTVQVEASDTGIKASQTAFKVGVPYHFVLKNAGTVAHEVMVMPVVAPSQNVSMDEMDKMAMGSVEQEAFPPAATGSFDLTFSKPYAAGQLEFACHIAGHYEAGMHQAITVTQ